MESTALQTSITITKEQIDLIKKTIAQEATNDELQLFIYDCKRRGVHPLDRMIHFTKRKGKYVPVTGIDFMRSRAAETGEYAGSDDVVFDAPSENAGGIPQSALARVYRFVQSQKCVFSATARWDEYYPKGQYTGMWDKMPHTMLGKCAEALALRKAFPAQLSGLYAAEEMNQAGPESTTQPETEHVHPSLSEPSPPPAPPKQSSLGSATTPPIPYVGLPPVAKGTLTLEQRLMNILTELADCTGEHWQTLLIKYSAFKGSNGIVEADTMEQIMKKNKDGKTPWAYSTLKKVEDALKEIKAKTAKSMPEEEAPF